MAKLTDPEILKCYGNALANWRFDGFVEFSPLASNWIERELGAKPRDFVKLLYDFVTAGGEIDQVVETRPEWNFWSHHYDLRLTMGGRNVYVETRLDYQDANDPDDPVIFIVNVHLA